MAQAPEDEESWEELTAEERRAGDEDLAALPLHGSFGKAVRAVAQQQRGCLANYLRSIQEDSAFVMDLRAHFPGWPLLANLRAGAWYAPTDAWGGSCYFKSTDGHFGHWDFSGTRLNLQVAGLAQGAGGALVVDSTRRGKRFPDSLSKTLPIWCAVLNMAMERRGGAGAGLRLPPWVEASERDQIQQRLPGWVQRLESLLPDDAWPGLAGVLWPCWMSPEGDVQALRKELAALPKGHVPILCVSASRHIEAQEHRERHSWHYIQGAGDDHENWARGLTPQLFWANAERLLSAEDAELVAAALARADGAAPAVCSHIGDTGLAVGSFAAAAPPAVWEGFAAVLNVGDGGEHVGMQKDPRSLAIPVADGKRADPSKNWWQTDVLPAALRFAGRHLSRGERVLIHCDHGDTRAPAVAAAILAAFRGAACWQVAEREGRLQLLHRAVVSKEALRKAMALVQRHHPFCAVPRRTMQQLNLFFVTQGGGWSSWQPEATGAPCHVAPAQPLPAVHAQDKAPAARPPCQLEEVWPCLFLGDARAACSLPLLQAQGISHVVNATAEPCAFPEDLRYCHLQLQDEKGAELRPHLEAALAFMHEALGAQPPPRLLVHCREGASRSVAVVLAYLMVHEGLGLQQASELLKSRRHAAARTKPNAGFWAQLQELEVRLVRGERWPFGH